MFVVYPLKYIESEILHKTHSTISTTFFTEHYTTIKMILLDTIPVKETSLLIVWDVNYMRKELILTEILCFNVSIYIPLIKSKKRLSLLSMKSAQS
jgi:hypothetical protein